MDSCPRCRRCMVARKARANVGRRRRIGADFFLYFAFLLAGARWLQLPNGYYLHSEHSENTSKNTADIAKDVSKSTETLLHHPVVAADPALVRALERRAREWESNEAF